MRSIVAAAVAAVEAVAVDVDVAVEVVAVVEVAVAAVDSMISAASALLECHYVPLFHAIQNL